GVERQCGGAALGGRGVAVVEELADVAEEQGAGEGGGARGGDLDDPHVPPQDPAHELGQGGGVEVVLEALTHGLQDDREVGVVGGDGEELGGAVPLLPQRLAAVGTAAGQQQGTGGGLPEAGGEVGRAGERLHHLPGYLVRVEEEVLGRDRQLPAVRTDVGQPQDDAVVRGHRGDVHPELFAQPGGEDQRPRGVHPRAVGGVDR